MIEKMRERITIERSEGARDKNGNHKLVWKECHSCYAYVNNLSGKEYWAASEVNAQDEVNFVIRYCEKIKDMDSEHFRIVFRGTLYNISFVDNVQYQNKTVKLRAARVKR